RLVLAGVARGRPTQPGGLGVATTPEVGGLGDRAGLAGVEVPPPGVGVPAAERPAVTPRPPPGLLACAPPHLPPPGRPPPAPRPAAGRGDNGGAPPEPRGGQVRGSVRARPQPPRGGAPAGACPPHGIGGYPHARPLRWDASPPRPADSDWPVGEPCRHGRRPT